MSKPKQKGNPDDKNRKQNSQKRIQNERRGVPRRPADEEDSAGTSQRDTEDERGIERFPSEGF